MTAARSFRPGTAGTRFGELARARAFHGLSEEDCQIWFGVGMATLERIEAGEVEPSDELDQRINRFLNMVGGGRNPPPSTGGGGAVAPASAASFTDGER